jgi:hypothetical protein
MKNSDAIILISRLHIMSFSDTITGTFCECGESKINDKNIGEKAKRGKGFNLFDLQKVSAWCKKKGVVCEIWDLCSGLENEGTNSLPPSYLLIIKDGVSALLEEATGATDLYEELKTPELKGEGYGWDKKKKD